MTAYLSPVPKLQFIDANGNPVAGGKLYTYAAGTTTPLATYTTPAGNVPNANPIILDSAGMANVCLSSSSYKMKLTTSTDVELWTVDNIDGNPALQALAASGGSALVGFIQSGTGAVARTAQAKMRDVVNVADFIPAGTNTATTDCQPYIRAAINEVIARGGGTVYIPPGEYRLTTIEGGVAHFWLVDKNDISIIGYGAFLKSTYSNTSPSTTALFLLDGCSRVSFEGFRIEANHTRTLGVPNDYSIGAFILQATNRDSDDCVIRNVDANKTYYFIIPRAVAVPTTYRSRNILIENCFYNNGFYGINCQNNGDNLTAINFRTRNAVRSYFVYGVANHNVSYSAFGNDAFTDCVISAFEINTFNINVNAYQFGITSVNAHATFESLHNPATQPVPATVKNVRLNINDVNSTTPSGGGSIRFGYFQNGVVTATSTTTLFDDIVISGMVTGYIDYTVAQPANSGRIDLSNLSYNPTGTAELTTKGFYQKFGVGVTNDTTAGVKIKNGNLAVYASTLFYDFADVLLGYTDATAGGSAFNWYSNVGKPWNFSYGQYGAYSAGTLVWSVQPATAVSWGVRIYEGANNTAPNAANSLMRMGQMNVTGRSISAAGTINATGNDYAEYENNGGLAIAKGSIVGFNADGILTLTYAEAVRFGVKSTAPSFVGGDVWCSDIDEAPVPPTRGANETDEEYAARMAEHDAAVAAHDAAVEAARANVDRVAYSGKVPVNVQGATPGGYIIAVDDGGMIAGAYVADPTFDQYKRAVGRVNRILDDGRAEIAVIVH